MSTPTDGNRRRRHDLLASHSPRHSGVLPSIMAFRASLKSSEARQRACSSTAIWKAASGSLNHAVFDCAGGRLGWLGAAGRLFGQRTRRPWRRASRLRPLGRPSRWLALARGVEDVAEQDQPPRTGLADDAREPHGRAHVGEDPVTRSRRVRPGRSWRGSESRRPVRAAGRLRTTCPCTAAMLGQASRGIQRNVPATVIPRWNVRSSWGCSANAGNHVQTFDQVESGAEAWPLPCDDQAAHRLVGEECFAEMRDLET